MSCSHVRPFAISVYSWRVPLISAALSVSKCHPTPSPTLFLAYIDGMRMRPIKHNGFLIRINEKRLNTSESKKKKKLNGRLIFLSIFIQKKKKGKIRHAKRNKLYWTTLFLSQTTNEWGRHTNKPNKIVRVHNVLFIILYNFKRHIVKVLTWKLHLMCSFCPQKYGKCLLLFSDYKRETWKQRSTWWRKKHWNWNNSARSTLAVYCIR